MKKLATIAGNMQNITEEELRGATAAVQAHPLTDETKTQSDSETSLKSIMHCQPGTKEQIALKGMQMIHTDQVQGIHRPTAILINRPMIYHGTTQDFPIMFS